MPIDEKIQELLENAKMYGEVLALFKKTQQQHQKENKIIELNQLEHEIIPIFEAALDNCFQLRRLEKQKRKLYKK